MTGEPSINDLHDMAEDMGSGDDIQTVIWTRELAKRLLLPRADIEALEDLLDTYFMQARSHTVSSKCDKICLQANVQVESHCSVVADGSLDCTLLLVHKQGAAAVRYQFTGRWMRC